MCAVHCHHCTSTHRNAQVVSDWQHSSRYKDNWPIVAYTVKHAKLGSRHCSTPPRVAPIPAKPMSSNHSTLVAADESGLSDASPTPPRVDRPRVPFPTPRSPARRPLVRQVCPLVNMFIYVLTMMKGRAAPQEDA